MLSVIKWKQIVFWYHNNCPFSDWYDRNLSNMSHSERIKINM